MRKMQLLLCLILGLITFSPLFGQFQNNGNVIFLHPTGRQLAVGDNSIADANTRLKVNGGRLAITPDEETLKALSFINPDDGESTFRHYTDKDWMFTEFDMHPSADSINLMLSFFKNTNSPEGKHVFFYRGNGQNEVSASIGIDGRNSFFNTHGGNFGIGTFNPRNPLEVYGLGGIRLTGDSHPDDAFMLLQPDVDVSALNPGGTTHAARITGRRLGHLVIDIEANDAKDAFAIRTDRDFDGTVDNIAMVVQPSGNVGIGTTDPAQKLDVAGNVRVRGSNGIAKVMNGDSNEFIQFDANDESISFYSNDHEALRIFNGGMVAIGTNEVFSGYKLAVDGKAICEELRVKLSQNWPDYVFEEGYKLLSLDEVEKTIQEKGHLP
ncbi:MAG: hypothetical protein KDD06_29545, partial [Phaeodactylibacter sp.]|nr:hypothetical protein [Phaeodactylibacter sp.]